MKKCTILQVDAFTDTPYTGNPAGVVPDAKDLDDPEMQVIAREMNVSETVFVLPSKKSGADLRMRWFTPTTEVPLCGHATIAGFHALAEEGMHGMDKEGTYYFQLDTASGLLPVEVQKSKVGIKVMFGLRLPKFERVSHYKLDLLRILNLSLSDFESRLAIVRSDFLYVPIRRLHTVWNMHPNFFTISNFLQGRNLQGLCVFTTETIDRDSYVFSRFFAPNVGINEDPVTGAANGPLGVYLHENGIVRGENGILTFKAEQGDVIGRKGRIQIELEVADSKPIGVRIGGTAVTVFRGEMTV
jgi:PhzF family phenazine biosynthesis protein